MGISPCFSVSAHALPTDDGRLALTHRAPKLLLVVHIRSSTPMSLDQVTLSPVTLLRMRFTRGRSHASLRLRCYHLDVHTDVSHMRYRPMVPYEAFACGCGAGDVVLRELYKPKTRGKLYYACPLSKPRDNCFGCGFFYGKRKEERVLLLTSSPGASSTPSYSPGPSTPPSYSPGSSTPQSYSPGSSRNAECSNCKHLLDKITVLKATMEMYVHPEQHTVNTAALLNEVYNDMGKLDLE
ncbi:hypothetical protein Tco_0307439 [Tanacetum coccineum]